MPTWIQLALQVLNNLTELINRETQADEKIKDTSIKSTRNQKKALIYARQIFDGNKKFRGLDVLLESKLEEDDYKEYLDLRKKFNKFS